MLITHRTALPSATRRAGALLLGITLAMGAAGCSRGNRLAPFPVVTTVTRLTRGAPDSPEGVPAWSRDGSRMYFPRFLGSPRAWHLCVAEVADGTIHVLTNPPARSEDLYPEESPTETGVIAFVRASSIGSADSLMIYHTQGDSIHFAVVLSGMYRPRWKPDGRQILFGAVVPGGFDPGYAGGAAMCVFNLDTGGTTVVASTYFREFSSSVLKYDWNPHRNEFTYESDEAGLPHIVQVVLGQGPPRRVPLTSGPLGPTDCTVQVRLNAEFSPSYAPDGSSVYYSSNNVVGRALYNGEFNGYKGAVPLLVDRAASVRCNEYGVPSHSGTMVAIEAGAEGGSQLWLRHLSEVNAIQLTALPAGVSRFFAAWSPDDHTLAVLERQPITADSTIQRIVLVKGYR